jgi:alkylation response protein AidB-like acyl-CoA dehydrogenase
MDFDFSEDQSLLVQALERWAADHMEIPADSRAVSYLPGEALAEELVGQGYYEVTQQSELGLAGAVLLIEAVGRTPWAIEVAASALVAPVLGLSNLPRPLAMMNLAGTPVARFLAPQGAALVDAGDHLRLLHCHGRVEPVKNPYAYPFGRFGGDLLAASEPLEAISIAEFRNLRRLAVTAEALAAMEAALNLTVDYVRSRQQFGKPIGSFQAVQHRLAECSVLVHGARLLLYRAAVEGLSFAHEAALIAHDAVKRILYESNQFHGAIGLTLEYPLHLWSYRLRVLQFELAASG